MIRVETTKETRDNSKDTGYITYTRTDVGEKMRRLYCEEIDIMHSMISPSCEESDRLSVVRSEIRRMANDLKPGDVIMVSLDDLNPDEEYTLFESCK